MFFDPLYLLFMLPATLIGLWAQFKLSSAYGRYSRVGLASRLSGAEAARVILNRAGLHHVPVEEVPGHLTDHYDPTKRALRLSSANFHSQSVSAVGVAAHEAGHALQHQVGYAPLHVRAALVPMTQIASYAWIVLILLGMFLKMSGLIYVGIGVFSVVMLFQLVTLPVEFDASKRAKEQLLSLGIVRSDESAGVSKVLSAAALTYVAALVASVMQLLYYLNVARSSDRD
jgi:Zn-dependent membrane protease YugP